MILIQQQNLNQNNVNKWKHNLDKKIIIINGKSDIPPCEFDKLDNK